MSDDAASREPARGGGSHPHWRANLRVMAILLSVWFSVSVLLGIVFVEPLNALRLGGFPLGFWFSQQGSIFTFVLLVWIYAVWMDRIDRRHGIDGDASHGDGPTRGGP